MFKKTSLKMDDLGNFGFVEKYTSYVYRDTHRIRALFGFDALKEVAVSPEIIREFVLTRMQDSEVPVERYLKSKKAIYSPLSEDILVIGVEVKQEKGSFSEGRTQVFTPTVFQQTTLLLRQSGFLLPSSAEDKLITLVNQTFDDREAFLSARLGEQDV